METLIKADCFNFKYGTKSVLEDIHFEVHEGEIVGLLGENGSGKTTLLNCMYGFQGEIESIRVLSTKPNIDNSKIKENISYIQDTPNLLGYLTAMQFLSFICNIEKIDFEEKKEEIMELVNSFGLMKELKCKLLKDYSFGMKKKIQIIAELFLHKKVIIIDEPTNGLDIRMIIVLRDLIKKENQTNNTTFIISSHNTGFLEDVCKRVLLFDNKNIVKNIVLDKNTNLESEFLMATSKNGR